MYNRKLNFAVQIVLFFAIVTFFYDSALAVVRPIRVWRTPIYSFGLQAYGATELFGNLNLHGNVFEFNKGGSRIYDNEHLRIQTDDNLFLEAPGTVYVQNSLSVANGLEVKSGPVELPNGSIGSADIADGSITSADLAPGAITGMVNPNFSTGSVVFQGPSGLSEDNSNFYWDDSNNRLGIGTTSPVAPIHISHATSDTTISINRGFFQGVVATPTVDSSNSFRSGSFDLVMSGSQNYSGIHFGLNAIAGHNGSGNQTGTINGLQGSVQISGGGTVANAIGGSFLASTVTSPATITTAVAGQFRVTNSVSGSVVTTAHGIRIQTPTLVGSSTIGTSYGSRINNQGLAGVTTSYGLFVDSQSGAGTSYAAIFQDGNVGVGTTTPQSTLHVPDGKYAQFEDNNAGPPPAGDCDNDAERGRQSIDTTSNLLYVCNGAARGWDSIALSN